MRIRAVSAHDQEAWPSDNDLAFRRTAHILSDRQTYFRDEGTCGTSIDDNLARTRVFLVPFNAVPDTHRWLASGVDTKRVELGTVAASRHFPSTLNPNVSQPA